ncbi:MAG TPA: TetR/AcrR family transcriptional regulator [Thermoanaerobaculia bacterium]
MNAHSVAAEPVQSTKRERILRAAADVFARAGYFNAKVSEVAKEAGVADGTIYLYFENKEHLLVTIFREHARKHLDLLRDELSGVADSQERLRRSIRSYLTAMGRDRAIAIVFQVELRHSLKFMSQLSQQEVREYLEILRTVVEHGQQRGVFRGSLHPQFVAKAVFGILDEMVTSWVLSDKEYRLEETGEAVSDFVLRGLIRDDR